MNDIPQEHSNTPGWVNIALIASLCLNFLFIGLFGAAIWQRYDAFRGPPPHGIHAGTGPQDRAGTRGEPGHGAREKNQRRLPGHGVLSPRIMMDVVPEKAAEIRKILHARRDGLRPLRERAMTARADVHTLTQSKDFSDTKLRAALEKVKTADAALEAYALETLRQCYGRLSAQERQKMATISLQQIQDFQQQRRLRMQGRHKAHGPHGSHRGQRHGMNGDTPSE